MLFDIRSRILASVGTKNVLNKNIKCLTYIMFRHNFKVFELPILKTDFEFQILQMFELN